MPDHTDSPPARKRRVFKFVGGLGSLVQFMGVVALGGAGYAGYRLAGGGLFSATFAAWTGVGLAYCLTLLVVGGEMSKEYVCGHCGNRLAGKNVAVCPTCNGKLL